MNKCFDTNIDVNITLLHIRSTPIGQGLPSLSRILFNRLIQSLLPKINRMPVVNDYDDEHYDALKQRQQWADKHDTCTVLPLYL